MTAEERLDEACHRFMSDPALAPLLAWWAGDLCRPLPSGPVDALRLAMSQGDRERLSTVQFRAAAHVKRIQDVRAVEPDGAQRHGGGRRRAAREPAGG